MRQHLRAANFPPSALLLLDNAPSHPPVEELRSGDGNIIAMYMPPNVTALIQPMDQNVIRLTKLYYRASLLSMIVSNPKLSVHEHLKALTLKDAAIYLAAAWNKITSRTIVQCWRNLLVARESQHEFDSDDDLPLSTYVERAQDQEMSVIIQLKILQNELNPSVS